MKRQIRRGCFETNSSSMHSLIITKEDKYYTPEECESGAWVFDGKLSMRYDMEFERSPFDILSTFASKLRYAIASLCGGYCKREDADEIFDEQFLPIIKEVLPEVCEVEFREGERHVFYDDDGNEIEPKWDHQTMEPYYIDKNGKKKEAERQNINNQYDNAPDLDITFHAIHPPSAKEVLQLLDEKSSHHVANQLISIGLFQFSG